jgi:ferric-dicitrate binding protein FerR (iron transport regulator)
MPLFRKNNDLPYRSPYLPTVFALLLAAPLLTFAAKAQDETPRLGRVAGKITALLPKDHVLREERSLPATKEMVVLWGDVVKTETRGRVRIALSDGSTLNVGSDAQLRILKHDTTSQQTTLELIYGRMLATAVRITRPGGNFEVRTPAGVAGVVGTAFGVRASPASTDVLCREGLVHVRNADSRVAGEVILRPGEFTHVVRGMPPSAPARASAEQLRAGEDATLIPNSP